MWVFTVVGVIFIIAGGIDVYNYYSATTMAPFINVIPHFLEIIAGGFLVYLGTHRRRD